MTSTGTATATRKKQNPKYAAHNAASVEIAIGLAAEGFRVFPIYAAIDGKCGCRKKKCQGKHPAICGWQELATTDPEPIRNLFKGRRAFLNPAIQTGRKSQIVVLDVDPRHGGIESLEALMRKLSQADRRKLDTTPRVKTPGGGLHFYFKHPGGEIANSIGCLPGIDIKADGGLVAAPYAIGANCKVYAPEVPLSLARLIDIPDPWRHLFKPKAEFPQIDFGAPQQDSDSCTQNTQDFTDPSLLRSSQESAGDKLPAHLRELSTEDASLQGKIAEAIAGTLPDAAGKRHRTIFDLVRRLKSHRELKDRDPATLRPIVKMWLAYARRVCQTQDFESTWIDFLNGWQGCKYPEGESPLTLALQRARACTQPLPPQSADYESSELKLLVRVCRELQRLNGGKTFFLSGRAAGILLAIPARTAALRLKTLCADRIIKAEKPGSYELRRATEYRFCADRPGSQVEYVRSDSLAAAVAELIDKHSWDRRSADGKHQQRSPGAARSTLSQSDIRQLREAEARARARAR